MGSRTICLAGASGTIGRSVADHLLGEGRDLVCLSRGGGKRRADEAGLPEAAQWSVEGFDQAVLNPAMQAIKPDIVISCIASRSGAPRDAWAVDHAANLALLRAAEAAGASHFVLLSAICVQYPLLAFQHAKLAFEAELIASPIAHTIIRPTAFFKSLSGQIARVESGKPFFLFGDGELTRCKPISDRDLAAFIARCLDDEGARGAVLPIGGPGPAISLREQGELLFECAGRPAKFKRVPIGLFTAAERVFALGERVSPWFAQKSEYARIARYYATQSMLVRDPVSGEYSAEATPEYGSDMLKSHYEKQLRALRR